MFCLVLKSAPVPSRSSPPWCGTCSLNAQSSWSPRGCEPRKPPSRTWRRGSPWKPREPKPEVRAKSEVSGQWSVVSGQLPGPTSTHHAPRTTFHVSRFTPPLFYPPWEVLPHEARLPHADVISERLETLVTLTQHATRNTHQAPLVVTSVAALLQRTFPAGAIRERTRTLTRGSRIDPLDLVEWLEAQGYEPEAQVTQKGEIALRGGILDVYPLTSPWPVRLEFFGDELESLRYFDPLTQISREEITTITIPPAGELGLLKGVRSGDPQPSTLNPQPGLGTLLDYLPAETVILLCEPELLAERAQEYAAQVPEGDPFFVPWESFLQQAGQRGMTRLELSEAEPTLRVLADDASNGLLPPAAANPPTTDKTPHFASLEAFRPLPERAPEPQVAEAQRREFFAQLHRWLRQGYAVHVFCNNDGERQRFSEIWEEYGLAEVGQASRLSPEPA